MEIYKKCEFDDRYEISNLGNVRRLKCNGQYKIINPSVLNKNKTHPYYYIQIAKGGKRKNYLIHRLVCEAFNNREDDAYNVVDHIDRDTFNNNATNLRWVTQKINTHNSITFRNDIEGDNRKQQIAKLNRQKTYDLKKYYCDLCDIKCQCSSHLNIHNNGMRHKLKQEAKNELGDDFNEESYKVWRNQRYNLRRRKK